MPYIEEVMWADMPQSFKFYCKKICNENNYETSSEPTTPTAKLQPRSHDTLLWDRMCRYMIRDGTATDRAQSE